MHRSLDISILITVKEMHAWMVGRHPAEGGRVERISGGRWMCGGGGRSIWLRAVVDRRVGERARMGWKMVGDIEVEWLDRVERWWWQGGREVNGLVAGSE